MISTVIRHERRRRRSCGGARACCARAAGRTDLSEPRWPAIRLAKPGTPPN